MEKPPDESVWAYYKRASLEPMTPEEYRRMFLQEIPAPTEEERRKEQQRQLDREEEKIFLQEAKTCKARFLQRVVRRLERDTQDA